MTDPTASGEGNEERTSKQAVDPSALHQWVERAREEFATTEAGAPTEEMETYLEELQVAEEELQVQTDELQVALEEAESQRRRYRELFENAPFPYLTTDTSGKILEASRAAVALLQLNPEHVRGKPLPLYLTGEGDLRSRISRLAAGRHVQPWESEVRPRRGPEVAVEVSARRVAPKEGEGVEIHWVIQDMRPRHQARERERELHREQAARAALEQVAGRARFLSDASAGLMGVLDPPQVWKLAAELAGSQASAALLVEEEAENAVRVRGVGGAGDARRELEPLLDRVLEWNAGSAEPLPLHAIRMAMESGEPEIVPARETREATGAWVVVPIRSPDRILGAMALWLPARARIGEELLVARSLADRTAVALEAAAMFREVVRARREAEEASTTEADFLSIISHELRTPLTAIVSYAELLEDRASELPDKLAHYARQIAAAADHQRQLVEQILAYKRIQRDGESLEPEELDYRKVARSAVAMVQPQVGDRGLALDYVVPAVPVQGVADRGKLQQILTNLLSNAVRHTTEGHVRLTLETRHHWVVFRVEDTGEGIADEDLPRIFDRFWRGRLDDRGRGGSGLGLTITRELLDRMRGEIDVESEPGVGTTFTVRIPRVAVGANPPEPE